MSRAILRVAIAVLVTASLASAFGKVAPRATETVEKILPVGVYTRVSIINDGGNTIVNGRAGDNAIRVVAAKKVWGRTPKKAREALPGLRIAFNDRGDELQIRAEHDSEWNSTYEVEYFVTVPADFRVEAASGGGAIQVRKVNDVSVTTEKGDVVITNASLITVATAGGDVEIDSTSGPIDVTTASGNVRARLRGTIKSTHIGTGSGGVTLGVPRGLNADLAISTSKGPISTEGLTLIDARQSQYGVRGTLGEGGVPVEITTGKGGIVVTTRSLPSLTASAFLRPTDSHEPNLRARPEQVTRARIAAPVQTDEMEEPAESFLDTMGEAESMVEEMMGEESADEDTTEMEVPVAMETESESMESDSTDLESMEMVPNEAGAGDNSETTAESPEMETVTEDTSADSMEEAAEPATEESADEEATDTESEE